jgi:hypothetical protein
MSDGGDFAAMSDPDFLAERTRVREELQELTERFWELNEEFDRRARAAWASASSEAARVLDAPEVVGVAAGLESGRFDDVDGQLEAVADPAGEVRVATEGDRGPALLAPPADLIDRGER